MNDDFSTTMLFITSEIALALGIIVAIISILTLKRRKKKEGVARDLVRNYKAGEEQKRETLRLLLKEVFQMDDEHADLNTETLRKAEKQLFTHILKIYLGKDTECIHEIESDIHTLVQGYHAIASTHGANNQTAQGGDADENEKLLGRISVLKGEKERLQDELKIALETIDNIMKEYATMFSGGGDSNRQDPDKLKKLQETASSVENIKESLEADLKQQADEEDDTPGTASDTQTDAEQTASAASDEPPTDEEDDNPDVMTNTETNDQAQAMQPEEPIPDQAQDDALPEFDESIVPDIDLESNLAPENLPDEEQTHDDKQS